MKKNLLLFGVLLLLILSCITKNQGKAVLNTNSPYLPDTILFKESKYLFFENLSDTTYKLVWGNTTFKNTSSDTIHVLPNGKLTLAWVSPNAIGIHQGCGSSCFFAYVLPLTLNAKEKFYMYPLAFDTLNNLIAYGNDKNDCFITIENYISGVKMNLNEDFLHGPFTGFCIDSISFQSKGLFLKWKNSDEKEVTKFFIVDDVKK